MLKDLQVTLYEFFGYLFPGLLVVFALTIIYWAVFWPQDLYVIYTDFSGTVIAVILLLAYLAGHLAQGVGNWLGYLPAVRRVLKGPLPISEKLIPLVSKALEHRFGQEVRELKPDEMYDLCDQVLLHHGSLGERDIFTYREGFYRGVSVALALLALAFLTRLFRLPARVCLESPIDIHLGPLVLAVGLSVFGSWLSFQRYLRFAHHRIQSGILRFLALTTAPSTTDKKEK